MTDLQLAIKSVFEFEPEPVIAEHPYVYNVNDNKAKIDQLYINREEIDGATGHRILSVFFHCERVEYPITIRYVLFANTKDSTLLKFVGYKEFKR